MKLRLRPFSAIDADVWDAFCETAHQATFLHSRRFLSYHADRFRDCSVLIEHDGKLVALFPAAAHPKDARCVVSHPGITYGGILHGTWLKGGRMLAAMALLSRYYAENGYERLVYKAVPSFYHKIPAQDDLYALFRFGARRIRCDLSSTIDLQNRHPVSERRRRGQKKARQGGVVIYEGNQYLPQLWDVLTNNLKERYDTLPVHTLEEITMLTRRFPENIRCVVATVSNNVIAGVLLFITPHVVHTQYIASSAQGRQLSALDAVIEHTIEQAAREGKRWFDFGISNENEGMVLNEGLYLFKSEFGGGGTVHEFYELRLMDIENAAN